MLPPVDQALLTANPKFDALYRDLCNNRLNPNGTSKLDSNTQRERDAFREDLRTARVEAAKREMVTAGLQELSYKPDGLPGELQELVVVLASLLEGPVSEEDTILLEDDMDKFRANIKSIVAALSTQFRDNATALATVVDPDDPPSPHDLPHRIEKLKTALATSQSKAAEKRTALAQEVSKAHELQRKVLETSIRILEQTIHGSVARGTKAKVDYLATVAEGMSKKLDLQRAQLTSQLYSPELQEAVGVKFRELQARSRNVKRELGVAEEKLDEYGKVGGMEGFAREYADVLRETEKVKADIAKLKGGDR